MIRIAYGTIPLRLPGETQLIPTFLMAAMPWAVVLWVARSRGRYNLCFSPDDESLTSYLLSLMFTMPGVILSIGVGADSLVHLQDTMQGVFAGALVAAALALAAAWADPLSRALSRRTVLQAIFLVIYGYSALALLDTGLDTSAPIVYRAIVLDRRYHPSSRGTGGYFLTLAPWGPRDRAQETDVPWSLYHDVHTGDTVCVGLRSGAARLRWFTVEGCR